MIFRGRRVMSRTFFFLFLSFFLSFLSLLSLIFCDSKNFLLVNSTQQVIKFFSPSFLTRNYPRPFSFFLSFSFSLFFSFPLTYFSYWSYLGVNFTNDKITLFILLFTFFSGERWESEEEKERKKSSEGVNGKKLN